MKIYETQHKKLVICPTFSLQWNLRSKICITKPFVSIHEELVTDWCSIISSIFNSYFQIWLIFRWLSWWQGVLCRFSVIWTSNGIFGNRLGQEEGNKYFLFSSKAGKLEKSCEVLVYISMKGAEGKYTFLCEANTCLWLNRLSFELSRFHVKNKLLD